MKCIITVKLIKYNYRKFIFYQEKSANNLPWYLLYLCRPEHTDKYESHQYTSYMSTTRGLFPPHSDNKSSSVLV